MNTSLWHEDELYCVISNLTRDIDDCTISQFQKTKRQLKSYMPELHTIPEEFSESLPLESSPCGMFNLFSKKRELSIETIAVCIKNFQIFRIYRTHKQREAKLLFEGQEDKCLQFLRDFSQVTAWPVSAYVEGNDYGLPLNSFLIQCPTEYSLFRRVFLILRMNYDLMFRSRYKMYSAREILTKVNVPRVLQDLVEEYVGVQSKLAPEPPKSQQMTISPQLCDKILEWVPMQHEID